jgi:hypothetical protein
MTEDFIHEYKGYGRVPSKCRVKIFSDDGEIFICFEDIGDGTSVTNASEQLATEIVDKLGLAPANCRFFETYSQYNYDSFDEIIYQWSMTRDRWDASHPDWLTASEEIKNLFIN